MPTENLTGKAVPLTGGQLAKHYQVTKRTLTNWRKAGRIPFIRLSPRCVRYDLAAVEAALKPAN
jgi:hypothetical protein